MGKVIGIDLGTTNSVVAIMEGGVPKVIVNSSGDRTTPSVVGFTEKGDKLVGKSARNQQVTNPNNTVFSVKRFMGRRHNEVESEEKLVPYKVKGGSSDYVKVDIRGKEYTPEEISAFILQDLKKSAEDYLGEEVKEAVITVPAYFNDAQRQATKNAGEIAGLKVLRVLPEPTAAALAYGLDKKKNEKIFVFDLGGGTFDVSVLDVGDGVFEVLSISGDTHLGGDDFDQVVINHLADEFKNSYGIDLRKDNMALQRLKEAAEAAKKELSSNNEATVNLPFITADASGPKHLNTVISRSKFEQLISPLVEKCKKPVLDALSEAGLKASEINEVLLVGGSTRVPLVQNMVKDIFDGKEPDRSVNPDEVVAIGAAVQAGIASGDVKDILVLDVTPLSLGVETLGGVMTPMIEKNSTIPISKTEIFSTATDNQPAVTVNVLQGERKFAKDNRLLGTFNLEGIPSARRGTPQIEVSFAVDVNGILSVTAKDKATGKENKVTVQNSGGLTKEEIARMKKDAEEHEQEDKEKKELIDTRNQAESLIYSLENTLSDNKDKLEGVDLTGVNTSIAKLRELLKSDNIADIKSGMDELNKASHIIGESLYKKNEVKAEANAAETPASNSDNSDVIDAEVVK